MKKLPISKDIIISFTGTQNGATSKQLEYLTSCLKILSNRYQSITLIHGDCVGADSQVHDLAISLGCRIKIRPCYIKDKRAFKSEEDVIANPEHPLDRNKKIVNDGDITIGCPGKMFEELRSGTWATIRFSKKQNKPTLVIWPDGSFDWS